MIIGNSAIKYQDLLFRRLLGLALTLAVVVPGILAGFAVATV